MSPRVAAYPDSACDADADPVHDETRVAGHPAVSIAELDAADLGTPVATSPRMPSHLHLVRDDSSLAPARAASEDPALRPTSFDDYVGQAEVVENLRESVRAAKRGGWQLDHMLFGGPAGVGKTSLAGVIAAELGGKLHATSAPAIEHKGALAALLTTLGEGDVLFIDEIHALKRETAECLYLAMEDRVIDMPGAKRVIRIPLPKFTLLGATTHAGKLPKPLLDRFGFVWQLRLYTLDEMTTIVCRSATKLGIPMDEAGATVVARASRGTPRIANRLLRRVRDFVGGADVQGGLVPARMVVGEALAQAALAKLGIDCLGLDPLDRRYLALVTDRPVGVEAICAELGEDRSTIEDAVEPFLMQAGLIKRGGKGRLATEAGRAHLAEVAS
ncbi:MAG TPA: Holliday junction branch migration DNA helicase RuvB [Gaiellaceae bacterium]|nr:Holliday junction branch migration DNA helicase RuvB [Gaiellaceae bacterium]